MTVTESPSVVDAVRRGLEIHEHTGADGHRQVRAALTLTTNIERAPAQLWPLLTRPDELALWFGPVTGELREETSAELTLVVSSVAALPP